MKPQSFSLCHYISLCVSVSLIIIIIIIIIIRCFLQVGYETTCIMFMDHWCVLNSDGIWWNILCVQSSLLDIFCRWNMMLQVSWRRTVTVFLLKLWTFWELQTTGLWKHSSRLHWPKQVCFVSKSALTRMDVLFNKVPWTTMGVFDWGDSIEWEPTVQNGYVYPERFHWQKWAWLPSGTSVIVHKKCLSHEIPLTETRLFVQWHLLINTVWIAGKIPLIKIVVA